MSILSIMMPVILLMATGWILARKQILKYSTETDLIKLIFDISVPALMFVAILQQGIAHILNFRFAVGYVLSIVIVFIITAVIFKLWKPASLDLTKITMVGMNAAISNSTLISMPILLAIFKVKAVLPVAAMLIVSMLLIIPVFMFLLELNKKDLSPQNSKMTLITTALLNTAKQPFIIASLLAFLVTQFSIPVPQFILTFLNYLGDITVPCALIAVGMSLSRVNIGNINSEVIVITFLNLVLKSGVAFILAQVLHLSTLYAIALLVVSAAPTANTIYMLAVKYHSYQQETAAIIFLSTLFSMLTLPAVLWLGGHYWPDMR